MNARAWRGGGRTYGIRVGAPNRRKFFDPSWAEIEVEVDGEAHRFKLTDGFWRHCPEFRSPIIREWLRRHHTLDWPKGEPPRMELIPLGGNRFRLRPP